MKCKKCDAEIPEDATFCPKCGVRVGEKTVREEFQVRGSDLVDKVKSLIHEGNIRKIIVKDQDGKTVMEFPLTFGVIGVVLAPMLAALGAIATLAMRYTLVVERRQE
ncbi:MAG: DUF4342 domain-containing protein [Candidatus Bathyarchaeota archaeon]